ncbi:MAG: YciI family protein [Myxococcota bacterium]
MLYALLLYSQESDLPENMPETDRQAFSADFGAFNAELSGKDAFRGAQRLRTADTATTVRVESGQALVTDGPFAETKEALAGFFLIEAADLDEAIGWAKKIPSAHIGSVEIRPIWEGYSGRED